MNMPSPRPSPTAAARCGFSLVELLVVMAIMGILASVSMAFVSTARAKARSVECQNNLRDWITGASAFIDENRLHAYPPGGDGDRSDETAWYNILPRFMDLKPICEYTDEDRDIPRPLGGVRSTYVCPLARGPGLFSYAYNRHFVRSGKRLRASMVRSSSELVVFMDSPSSTACLADEGDVLGSNSDSFRHGGMMNVAFADGSVRSFRREKVVEGSDTPTVANISGILWNPWPEDSQGSGAGSGDL